MTKQRERDLTDRLNPYIGTTPAIRDIASTIESLARSYSRIQERWTSEEMSAETTARLEKREARIERQISDHVANLPQPTIGEQVGVWHVRFDGDPRAYVVTLIPAESRDDTRRESSREIGVA